MLVPHYYYRVHSSNTKIDDVAPACPQMVDEGFPVAEGEVTQMGDARATMSDVGGGMYVLFVGSLRDVPRDVPYGICPILPYGICPIWDISHPYGIYPIGYPVRRLRAGPFSHPISHGVGTPPK